MNPDRSASPPTAGAPRPEPPFGTGQVRAGDLLAGRYRLLAPIANGGMAQVWRAEDSVLGRLVAAKVLHPHLAADQAFLLRFRREAIAAARLSHRSIVAIFDTVSDGNVEAIIMELGEGRTMRAVLDQSGPLPLVDVIEIGIQISEALAEAHRGGVVHRDIKPSNILLCPDRRVMVTDFGIAKAGEDTDLTVTGTLLGTAKYLSPEQVLGDDVDPRSDLYSFGVVLYEALAGRPPFRAETDAATALARLHQNPRPLTEYRSDLPPALVAIVDRLLARNPDDRPRRALDVRVALAAVALPSGPAPLAVDDATRSLTPAGPAAGKATAERVAEVPRGPVGTDLDDDVDDEGFLRSERAWIVPTLILGALAGALALAAVLITRPPTDPAAETGGTGDGVSLAPFDELVDPAVAALRSVDRVELGGDGSENDDQLALAYDGDSDTMWRSDTYASPPFGGLKPGIGVIVDLAGRAILDEIELETASEGWSATFYVGDDFSGPIETWGDPVAGGERYGDGRESFDLAGARGTQIMIWITDPGLAPDRGDPDDQDDIRFELAEVVVS